MGISGFCQKFLVSECQKILRINPWCFREFLSSKNFMDKRRVSVGVSRHSVANLLSQSTEKLRRGASLCFRNFRVSESICIRRQSTNFSRNFLSSFYPKLLRKTLCCIRKKLLSKNYMNKRCGSVGVSRNSVNKLLSHSAEKFPRGNRRCFRKSLV